MGPLTAWCRMIFDDERAIGRIAGSRSKSVVSGTTCDLKSHPEDLEVSVLAYLTLFNHDPPLGGSRRRACIDHTPRCTEHCQGNERASPFISVAPSRQNPRRMQDKDPRQEHYT